MLSDTPYMGTLSTLTRYGTMATSHARMTGKLMRGKVKGNKREPRTRGPASECVSYYLDEHNNKVKGRIFSVSHARNAGSKAKVHKALKVAETARLRHGHNYANE